MEVFVLVAEDDSLYRKYFENILREAKFGVISCENGEEALKIFAENPALYRVLIIDLLMPIMSGYELIRRVRNDFKDVYPYIFVITSLESEDNILRALDLGADEVLLKPISSQRLVAEVLSGLQKLKMMTFDVLVKSLVAMMDLRDKYTGNHSRSVSLISKLLATNFAEKMSVSGDFIENLSVAGLLHDVGKVLIPEYILEKPGALTKDEYEIVKQHTTKGSEILHEALKLRPEHDTLRTIHEVIRHHHENYDGTGYPDGLKAEQIPLSARIVRIADVFCALTSDRYYRKAFSPEKAFEIMMADMREYFDPDILRFFAENRKFFLTLASSKEKLNFSLKTDKKF